MAVEVRPATPADVGGVRDVAEAAWHAAHAPIVGASAVESFLERYYDAAAFERLLEADEAVFAVADGSDAGVVGFVSARPDESDPEASQLGRIYVTPDRWGEGLGRRLLEHVESRVREQGGERIALGVMAENDRAVRFYEAAGYQRVDIFEDERLDITGYTYEKAL